jgi:ribulose-phosphate 3-epimerase
MIKIAPSILAADFTKLGEDIQSVRTAEYLHFDVMDGHFVDNLSFGIPVLESVRKVTDMALDVHLMIESPLRFISKFAHAGADIITFHVEAVAADNIRAVIDEIHGFGKKAGLSVKPDTPAGALLPFIDSLDLVLVMTVEPGYGGQAFISQMLPKISELRSVISSRGLECELEVDGGINRKTAKLCIDAGANVLVAGADVFGAADRAARIEMLRGGLQLTIDN